MIFSQNVIYVIRCSNGFSYVGKTRNPGQRCSSHKSLLKKGCHPCTLMQDDWNAFGPQAFTFHVVDIQNHDEDRESTWIARLNDRCYNKVLLSGEMDLDDY